MHGGWDTPEPAEAVLRRLLVAQMNQIAGGGGVMGPPPWARETIPFEDFMGDDTANQAILAADEDSLFMTAQRDDLYSERDVLRARAPNIPEIDAQLQDLELDAERYDQLRNHADRRSTALGESQTVDDWNQFLREELNRFEQLQTVAWDIDLQRPTNMTAEVAAGYQQKRDSLRRELEELERRYPRAPGAEPGLLPPPGAVPAERPRPLPVAQPVITPARHETDQRYTLSGGSDYNEYILYDPAAEDYSTGPGHYAGVPYEEKHIVAYRASTFLSPVGRVRFTQENQADRHQKAARKREIPYNTLRRVQHLPELMPAELSIPPLSEIPENVEAALVGYGDGPLLNSEFFHKTKVGSFPPQMSIGYKLSRPVRDRLNREADDQIGRIHDRLSSLIKIETGVLRKRQELREKAKVEFGVTEVGETGRIELTPEGAAWVEKELADFWSTGVDTGAVVSEANLKLEQRLLQNQIDYLDAQATARNSAVSPAGFKKDWEALAFKQGIWDSLEHDADYFAWAPGWMVAGRASEGIWSEKGVRLEIRNRPVKNPETGKMEDTPEFTLLNRDTRRPEIVTTEAMEIYKILGRDLGKYMIETAKQQDRPQKVVQLEDRVFLGGEGFVRHYDEHHQAFAKAFARRFGYDIKDLFEWIPLKPKDDQMRQAPFERAVDRAWEETDVDLRTDHIVDSIIRDDDALDDFVSTLAEVDALSAHPPGIATEHKTRILNLIGELDNAQERLDLEGAGAIEADVERPDEAQIDVDEYTEKLVAAISKAMGEVENPIQLTHIMVPALRLPEELKAKIYETGLPLHGK